MSELPESPISEIGVVMLGVTDLDRAVAFYRDRLDLNLTGEHQGFAFFDGGGVSLALSRQLSESLGAAPGAVEVVFSVAHVREAFTALVARGVEFDVEPRAVAGPMWAANFQDPDGHRLSIFGQE